MKRVIKCTSDVNMTMCVNYLLNTKVVDYVDSVEFIDDKVIVNMLDGTGYWFEVEK